MCVCVCVCVCVCNGGYKAVAEAPAAEFGFVGKVHSVAAGDYTTMVRIAVVRNVQVTAQ